MADEDGMAGGGPAPAADGAGLARAARRLPRWLSFGAAPFAFSLVIALAVNVYVGAHGAHATSHHAEAGAASGPSAALGSSSKVTAVQLLNVAPVRRRAAPGFALTDQRGHRVTLAAFRGKEVLLGFFDPYGTRAEPVVSQEILAAAKDLGQAAHHVAFVGVDVNTSASSPADLKRFSAAHGLAGLANWHFLTGKAARLAAVWKAYGVNVSKPPGAVRTAHSDFLYFIGPGGAERYLAEPVTAQRGGKGRLAPALAARAGRGIADYLRRAASDPAG